MVSQLRALLTNEMVAIEIYTSAIAQATDALAKKLRSICLEHRALVADLQHALGPEGVGIFRGQSSPPWSEFPRPARAAGMQADGRVLVAILRRGEAEGLQLAARMARPKSRAPLRRFVRACILPPLRTNLSRLDALLSEQI
jgi:hypothetical protein